MNPVQLLTKITVEFKDSKTTIEATGENTEEES